MGRLFGTDGVRGVANAELDCELAINIGRAAAMVLTEQSHHKPVVLIGKDTRISSDMLENALVAGLSSVGADTLLLGVVPTPAVAYLVKRYGADAGIMISASHNPVEFNGIKIFNGEGFKLSDSLEDEIEAIIRSKSYQKELKTGVQIGRPKRCQSALDDYIEHLQSTLDGDLTGMRIAMDCANGSSSVTAEKLFTSLGAQVAIIHRDFDGTNINDGCGSTHIDELQRFMKGGAYDLGLSFDGDADRCLALDGEGNLIDGDNIIAIISRYLKEHGKLKQDTAVVTVMSNIGFFKFAKEHGINTAKTAVGDRYVLEEMLSGGYNIGGEQSGHVILLDHMSTGDGQLTGLWLTHIVKETKKSAKELASAMQTYPQVLINIKVDNARKSKFDSDEEILAEIQKYEEILGEEGRILVRASGTEPLVRVMIEGKNQTEINEYAEKIADKIKERLC
ncbi:phosphoglucosamine mutase [Candidatus Soleaferrea massiliensis]|uniref:phosphoglucosamine mutase n=1 Tax=Candidatus Soleaferrea massiliensis TaxID=1470354 RepID=UPI00058F4EF0|nr:phosphoglucosamine mutase [Candidatus Soleaferrea massiliensis]